METYISTYEPETHKDYYSDNNRNDCLDDVQRHLASKLKQAYRKKDNILIESLPVTGKTHSTFEQAAETNTNILFLTSINNLKEDAVDYCKQFELTWFIIPTPHTDCPSMNGDDERARELKSYYRNGVSGPILHEEFDLPCQQDEDCPYMQQLDSDLDQFDVLIGNPKHAYNDRYLTDRVVVKDEFSEGEYETTFRKPRQIINYFLRNVTLSFDSYDELLEERGQIGDNVIVSWYEKVVGKFYRDVPNALRSEEYHTLAPFLTYAVLYAEDHNGDWERFSLQDLPDLHNVDSGSINENAVVARNSRTDTIYLLNPPDFSEADGFIGLDGTPDMEMWQTATGLELESHKILSDDEKQKYVTDILNLDIIQLADTPRYYHNSDHVADSDIGFAFTIWQIEGEKPGLVTSKKAINEYDDEMGEYISSSLNFKRVLSYDGFKEKQVGFVSGMRHYSDGYIRRWATYQDKSLQIDHGSDGPTYQYGSESFDIFPYFRKLTLQDVFRFGRNEESTTVYVHTSGLPDWVPRRHEDITPLRATERDILSYLLESDDGCTASDVSEGTDHSERNAKRKLNRLEKMGVIVKSESSGAFQPDIYRPCE